MCSNVLQYTRSGVSGKLHTEIYPFIIYKKKGMFPHWRISLCVWVCVCVCCQLCEGQTAWELWKFTFSCRWKYFLLNMFGTYSLVKKIKLHHDMNKGCVFMHSAVINISWEIKVEKSVHYLIPCSLLMVLLFCRLLYLGNGWGSIK